MHAFHCLQWISPNSGACWRELVLLPHVNSGALDILIIAILGYLHVARRTLSDYIITKWDRISSQDSRLRSLFIVPTRRLDHPVTLEAVIGRCPEQPRHRPITAAVAPSLAVAGRGHGVCGGRRSVLFSPLPEEVTVYIAWVLTAAHTAAQTDRRCVSFWPTVCALLYPIAAQWSHWTDQAFCVILAKKIYSN